MIIATARAFGYVLATRDAKILDRQRRRVVTDPFLEDQRHVAYLRLPAQRVAVDDDQVGQLARLDGAELLVLARHAGSVFPTQHGFTK